MPIVTAIARQFGKHVIYRMISVLLFPTISFYTSFVCLSPRQSDENKSYDEKYKEIRYHSLADTISGASQRREQ
jgi:hypothetical protein